MFSLLQEQIPRSARMTTRGIVNRKLLEINREIGGRRGDRTPDLCIANAALSQLS
jgi:hypothetical protein